MLLGRFGECAAVIALAGKNRQAVAPDANFDGVVVHRALALGRIRQGVLVAGLFRDARIKFREGVLPGAVVNVAASIARVADQAVELSLKVGTARGYAVDADFLAQQLRLGFVIAVSVELRAVLAVGNQEDDLAAFAAVAILQQVGRLKQSVVKRLRGLALDRLEAGGIRRRPRCRDATDGRPIKRTSGRSHGRLRRETGALQLSEQIILVPGETLPFVEKLIEAADEGFVAGAEAADDRRQAGLHLLLVFAFQVVVNQDDQGKRHGLNGKTPNLLLHVVFQDAKFIPAQIRNQITVAVFHRDGDNDRVCDDPDRGRPLWLTSGLGFLRRGWRSRPWTDPILN